MALITITLVVQESMKHAFDLDSIQRWKSKVFKITRTQEIRSLPNMMGVPTGYPDSQLQQIFTAAPDSDLTVVIIGAALQDNFFARIPVRNLVVLSLFEMVDILEREHFTIESYITVCIYWMVLCYVECGRKLTLERALPLHHDEARGCLYDFDQNKVEIVRALDRPKLCADCLARLGRAQIDLKFKSALFKELFRIRKRRYFRILDWAKRNPIKALLLTTVWAILLNLAANVLYDSCKSRIQTHSASPAVSTSCSPSSTPCGSAGLRR